MSLDPFVPSLEGRLPHGFSQMSIIKAGFVTVNRNQFQDSFAQVSSIDLFS
jgi:hypothetical protein